MQGGHVVAYPEGRIGLTPDGWPERGRTGMARLALGARRAGDPGEPVGRPRGAAVPQRLGQGAHPAPGGRAAARAPGARRPAGGPRRPAGRPGGRRQPRPLPHRRGDHPRPGAAARRRGRTGRPSSTPPARPPPSPRSPAASSRTTCREPLERPIRTGTSGDRDPSVLDRRTGGWEPAPVTTAPPAAGAAPAVPPVDRALKRERFGWYSYDWAMSVFNTSVTTVFLAPYLTAIAESAADADGRIHPLGISVPPGSFFGYVLSLSVLLQVLVLPLTGAIADRSGHKRQMLAAFATLGSLCTMAMFFVADERYMLGAGAVHRRQPLLRRRHGRLLLVAARPRRARRAGRRLQPGLGLRLPRRGAAAGRQPGAVHRAREPRADRGRGRADLPGLGRRLVGRASPSSASPCCATAGPGERRGRPRRSGALSGGFRQLGATLRDLRRYPLTLWFLGAYLLFNDGVQTIIGVSAQYGEGAARALPDDAGLGDPAGPGGRLLRRAGARPDRRAASAPSAPSWARWWPGPASWWRRTSSRPARRCSSTRWRWSSASSWAAPRRCPGRCSASSSRRARRPSTSASTRSATAAPAGSGPFLFALTYQLTDSYRYAIFSLVFFFVVGGFLLAKLNMRQAIVEAGNTPPERV